MKILVRYLSENDLPNRVRWLNDERVNAFQFLSQPVTLETTKAWYSRVVNNSSRRDFVFRDAANRPLAMAGLTSINAKASNAEYYVFINPDFQGMGVGKAATSWVMNYAFESLMLLKVYLFVDPRNIRAWRMYEKLGFSKEGTLRKHRSKDGRFFDMHVYGILKNEWVALQEDNVFCACPG